MGVSSCGARLTQSACKSDDAQLLLSSSPDLHWDCGTQGNSLRSLTAGLALLYAPGPDSARDGMPPWRAPRMVCRHQQRRSSLQFCKAVQILDDIRCPFSKLLVGQIQFPINHHLPMAMLACLLAYMADLCVARASADRSMQIACCLFGSMISMLSINNHIPAPAAGHYHCSPQI
jgi:hypothetical protein